MQALLAEVIHVGDAQTTTQGLICTVLVAQLGRLALAELEFDRDQLVVEHIRTVKNDAERALADLLAYAVVHANNALVQLARHRLVSMVEGVRKRRIEFVLWEGVMMMVLRAGAGKQQAGPAGWWCQLLLGASLPQGMASPEKKYGRITCALTPN